VLVAVLVPAMLAAACSSGDNGSQSSGNAGSSSPAGDTGQTSAAASTSASGAGGSSSGASGSSAGSGAPGSSSGAGPSSPAGGQPVDCTSDPADGPLQFYTDKAAWQPDFESMNEKSKSDCNLEITFTGYSDPAQYDAFIKQGFQTDQKPTLFTWHTGDQLKALVDQGLIAETTDLWNAAEANGDVPEGLKDNYTYNGKQYCVPLNVAYWVMYYNKKIFADNNLQVPKTWDDLINVADTLVSKGITPFHQMNIIFEFVWFQALLVGSDPDAYQGLETGDTKYTDQPVVDAVKKWYEMENKKYFIDPGVQTDPQTLLKTGKVAMEYFGTFFTGQLTSIGMKSDEDYGVFVLPNVSPDVSKQQMVLETGPLCVGAGSANEKAALDYSAWWMGQDAQQAWSDKRGDVSFNPKVKAADPALSALLAGQADWQIQKRWLEATPNPIYTVASPAFGEFVTNPTADPMPMLTKIQQAADKYWSEQ
jgi:ABC-type glycerol-3-phosphate transport system substrate-binding protein